MFPRRALQLIEDTSEGCVKSITVRCSTSQKFDQGPHPVWKLSQAQTHPIDPLQAGCRKSCQCFVVQFQRSSAHALQKNYNKTDHHHHHTELLCQWYAKSGAVTCFFFLVIYARTKVQCFTRNKLTCSTSVQLQSKVSPSDGQGYLKAAGA